MANGKRLSKASASLKGEQKGTGNSSQTASVQYCVNPSIVDAAVAAVVGTGAPRLTSPMSLTREMFAAMRVPTETQERLASAMLSEVEQHTAEGSPLVAVFPELLQFGTELRSAVAWSAESETAWQWSQHADLQRAQAWTRTFALLAQVRAGIAFLAQRDPTLLSRFPALQAFLAEPVKSAQRGAERRKEREAQKRAEEEAAKKPDAPKS